jgi:tetrahydromethanopterin S-methyltransferase subunit B
MLTSDQIMYIETLCDRVIAKAQDENDDWDKFSGREKMLEMLALLSNMIYLDSSVEDIIHIKKLG